MSNLPCHAGHMKIKKRYQLPHFALMFQPTIIAHFGGARLVRHLDGRYELIGGTAEQHAAAREWCSLFAPEVVFTSCARQEKMVRPARSVFRAQTGQGGNCLVERRGG